MSSLSKTQRRQLQKDVQDRFQVKTVVECCFCLVVFRWLGWSFQGQYLLSLRHHSQRYRKTISAAVSDKDENLFWAVLCYVDDLQPYFYFFFPRLLIGAFFSNTCFNIREVWAKSMRAFSKYFGIKFTRVEIYTKDWTILIFGRYLNKARLKCNLTSLK